MTANKTISHLRLALIATFFAIQFSAHAQDYQLKLMMYTGQHFSYTTINDIDLIMKVQGSEIPMKTKSMMVYTQALRAITAKGDFVMDFTFSRIGMDITSAAASISYDTDDKGEKTNETTATLDKVLKPLLNRNFTVTITPTGKVASITGLKEIYDSLAKGLDPAQAKMLKGVIDEDKLKKSLESSYGYLPATKVKVGDHWTQKVKMDLNFTINMDVTYTLKEVKGNTGKIDYTAKYTTIDDNYMTGGVKMKLNITGAMKGKCELDMKTGLFTTVNSDMTMNGTMEAEGTQITMTGTGKSNSILAPIN